MSVSGSKMIQGYWYVADSAARSTANLVIQGSRYTLLIDGKPSLNGALDELTISDRIGNTERKITLADGSVFATLDNAAIDSQLFVKSTFKHAVHRFESHWGLVIIAFFTVVVLSFSFVTWGLPAISEKVARALPQKTNEVIGAHSLTFLDDYLFEDSLISQEQQHAIRQRFADKLLPIINTPNINYTLHFRQWNMGDLAIPNALALPSGDIILTDKFVELSQNSDEIDAVLLHEVGHIVHRHGLEGIVRGSLTSIITLMIFGDTEGIADVAVGATVGLLSSHYSREQESEADLYAFQKMLVAKINPQAFSSILNRLEQYAGDETTLPHNHEHEHHHEHTADEEDAMTHYFSSHPSTAERSRRAEQFYQCFIEGRLHCEIPL